MEGVEVNEASSPVDCQEILIGELFEESSSVEAGQADGGPCDFVCHICLKRFDAQKKLTRHVECHSRRRFKCDVCGQFLKSRSSLNSHQQRHLSGKSFQCDMCGKGFAAARDLKNHRKVHDGQAERYQCDECGKDFGRIYSLLDHKKLHSGKEVFGCDKCDKVFPKRRNLLLHQRSHLVDDESCS